MNCMDIKKIKERIFAERNDELMQSEVQLFSQVVCSVIFLSEKNVYMFAVAGTKISNETAYYIAALHAGSAPKTLRFHFRHARSPFLSSELF